MERACEQGGFAAEAGEEPGAASLFALPLVLQERRLGGIVLEVEPTTVSVEGSDRRFLDALASEMAVALDRVRLIGRERERQREEKEQLEAEVTDLRRVVHGSRLAYRSVAMESLLATARKVAHTDATVLITGESGTGKEMLAHTVHELSGRRDKPVVVVDCGAISPTLIESELFGHEKGAFTGAHARKPGRLAQADGATVFLDEIGELPLDLQSKLLRFVQEKQFTPVGSVTARRVDVRIIAATNVDLRARVADGRFREDLFHRLNVVRLHVPPLRERKHDIVHLANIFLQQFAALYRRPAHHFTARAEEQLEQHPWLGNVRELQNLVLTSVLFCDAAELDAGDLNGFQASPPPALAERVAAAPVAHDARGGGSNGTTGASSKAAGRLRRTLGEEIAAAPRVRAPDAPAARRQVAERGAGAGGRPPRRRSDPPWGRHPRRARDDVSATAGSRVPRTGGRAPRPLCALARGRERARGRDPGPAGPWGHVRVGRGLPHRRDRVGGSGRRAHRVPAPGRDRAHLDAPQSRVPAPSSGRWRAGILIAPPRRTYPTAALRAQLADHDRDSRRRQRGSCTWHLRCY